MKEAPPLLLLIDDEQANLDELSSILGEHYDVAPAQSVARALSLCDERLPELILLDIEMPDMSGFDACRRFKADPRLHDIPVLVVTSHTAPEIETLALRAGAVDFVPRPINPHVLRARVQAHVRIRRQAEHLRSLAFVDPISGLANRRAFDRQFEEEWRVAKGRGQHAAVLLVGLPTPDAIGPQQHDENLRTVGASLRRGLEKAQDLLARYDESEFVCVKLVANPQQGIQTAARLLHLASVAAGTVHVSGAVLSPKGESEPMDAIRHALDLLDSLRLNNEPQLQVEELS